MRFADASHVDLGSFYARRPGLGRIYRLFGYAACITVLFFAADPGRHLLFGSGNLVFALDPARLLVLLLIAWLMAWKREVGALWRSSLIAAIVMCAVLLTCGRLGYQLVPTPPPAPAPVPVPAASDGPPHPRQIIIDYQPGDQEKAP